MTTKHTPGKIAQSKMYGGEYICPVDHVDRPVGGATDRQRHVDTYMQVIAKVPKDQHDRHDAKAISARIVHTWNCHDELVAALEALIGGKCPKCNGWGEVSYFGEIVGCRCGGNYRHTPTDEQIKNAQSAIAKAKGE